MQEEGGAKKGLNPALEKHWDKIVLGLVGVGFVIFLGGQFASGKNTPAKRVVEAKTLFDTKKNTANPTFASPKPPPEVKTPAPVMAMKGPEWTIGMQTKYTPDIRDVAGPVAVGFFLPKLTLSAPQPTVKGVELRWSLSGEPDPNQKPQPIKVPPASFFYKIERRKKGEVKWQVLEPELKGNQRYIDRGTTPKTEFEYQVTLGSSDPVWGAKNPTRLSEKVGGPYATTTPGIWEFSFSNVTPGDPDAGPPPIPATVYVKIVKYDPEYGKVEWSRIHKDKDPLGFLDNVSKHPVWSDDKKKTVEIDFNCGGKILSITADKLIPYEYKVCDRKPGPGGLVCAGPETKKDHYRAHLVKFTDEEAKTQEVQWASGAAPMLDKLCPDHGGAPPPKPSDPAEIAAAKEKEVEKLLDDADRLWSSDEPSEQKKAQEKYMKLIKSHAESPAVKARRNEINERIKKKVG